MAILTAPDGALLRSGTFVDLTSDWTIFLWAAPVTSTPTGGIFREYYQIGDVGYVYLGSQGDTNDVMLLLSDDGTTNFYESTHVATPLGDWFWCAATYDSTSHDLKFYVNSATAIDTLNHNLSSGFNFGTRAEQSCTFGAETQVAYERIWQSTLTGAELLAESASSWAVTRTSLLADTPLIVPANLDDTSGNNHDWTVGAGAFAYIDGPLVPTNTTALTALELPALPFNVAQETQGEAELWYAYTARTSETIFGLQVTADTAYYQYSLLTGDASSPDQWVPTHLITGDVTASQVPMTPGDTYFILLEGLDFDPVQAVGLDGLQQPDAAVPAGSLFITDDVPPFPAAVLDSITGEVLKFVNAPASDFGDSVPSGVIAIEQYPSIYLFSPVLEPIVTLSGLLEGNIYRNVRSNQNDAFYIGSTAGGSAAAVVHAISLVGATLDTWTLPADSAHLHAMSPNQDDTVLYYADDSTGAAIHRYDLVNRVALSDLVAGVTNYTVGKDILVLADDSIIVQYDRTTVDHFIRRYDAAGATLHTYSFGTLELNRLAIGRDDPDSFWIWSFPDGAFNATTRIQNVNTSTGATISTFDRDTFVSGTVRTTTGVGNRFGNDDSCALILTGEPVAPTTGTIVVVKENLITGDTTEFDFGTNGAPLTPTSFTLADGDSQTFLNIPVGSGYAVNENVQANWSVTYTVSNGSPIDNISVDEGETVVVTAINTFNPPSETDPIRRLRQFEIPTDENKQIFISKLEVLLQSGVGLVNGQGSDPQVAFSLSRDGGKTWGPEHWTSAGKMGEYLQRVIWRQLGQARNPVGRIVVSDPVFWALIDAYFDGTPGTS